MASTTTPPSDGFCWSMRGWSHDGDGDALDGRDDPHDGPGAASGGGAGGGGGAGELLVEGDRVVDRTSATPVEVDLRGACALPGFNDSHVHFPTWAAAQQQ